MLLPDVFVLRGGSIHAASYKLVNLCDATDIHLSTHHLTTARAEGELATQ